MSQKKISPAIEKEILAKATEGATNRAIAEWLRGRHGLKISHQSVGKLLKQTRQARGEVAKAVVRDVLVKTVVGDLARLTREQIRVAKLGTRLHKRAVTALDESDRVRASVLDDQEMSTKDKLSLLDASSRSLADLCDLALKTTDRAAKLADLKLHYAGADSKDDKDAETAPNDELLARLDSLASRSHAARAAAEDDPEPSA